jgi:hypothetical protein
VRNILGLFLNHTGVDPGSGGEVYSGAWAFPESCGCCGRSLWYGPMELAPVWAQYGVEAGSPWAREIARRMQILATYDGHDTGVSEDNLDGGFVVNADWFKIAHPMALKHMLNTIAWMPEEFAPARENHIVRSTGVVKRVNYGRLGVAYETFEAQAPAIDVLRLAFLPERIFTENRRGELRRRDVLDANGYTIRPLEHGDCLVTVRHDGVSFVGVVAPSPEQFIDCNAIARTGSWTFTISPLSTHTARWTAEPGATATVTFTGNRIQLVGQVWPSGGLADVYLDGVKQLVGIDCWKPASDTVFREGSVLYYRNGLPSGRHVLKIVALGKGNPRSSGARVYLEGAHWSDATGKSGVTTGEGPTDTQRMVFGYTGRDDLKDSAGQLWRSGTEWVVRLGGGADSVAKAWWTTPTTGPIAGTPDPDLYRYGIHGRELVVNITVGPGTYHARLKFASGRGLDSRKTRVTIAINGKTVASQMDVAATAGGSDRAVDLVFDGIEPRNGVIDVRLTSGNPTGEAFVQALEVGPGPGGAGAKPVGIALQDRSKGGR